MDPRFLHVDSEDWSYWTDAQADLSLRWVDRTVCWFGRALAHLWTLWYTVLILKKLDRQGWENRVDSDETVPSLIIISDLCHFICMFWTHYQYPVVKPYFPNFKVISVILSGIQTFYSTLFFCQFEVKVYDEYYPKDFATTRVRVIVDRNPGNPYYIEGSSYNITIGETHPYSSVVLDLNATDPDGVRSFGFGKEILAL